MSGPRDKEVFIINPLTGELEVSLAFNPDRIVTNTQNSSGRALVIYDPVLGSYEKLGPLVVTDNDGNTVTT